MAGLGFAIDALKSGGKVARLEWKNCGNFLDYQESFYENNETFPCICINYLSDFNKEKSISFRWIPLMSDLLADDWVKL